MNSSSTTSKQAVEPGAAHPTSTELRNAEAHLRGLLAAPPGTEDADGVITLLANVAHLFVYLEGNQQYLPHAASMPWRGPLLDDLDVRLATLRFLERTAPIDPDRERLRQQWIARLQRLVADDPRHLDEEHRLSGVVNAVLTDQTTERIKILDRLNMSVGPVSPEAVLFRVISGVRNPATRNRLAAAWNQPRNRFSSRLIDLVDEIVDVRRQRARAEGYPTPLARSLVGSSLIEAEAESFVQDYLQEAVAGHKRLSAVVRAATNTTDDDPLNHVPFYLRQLTAGRALPLLPLHGCIRAIAEVVGEISGCEVEREQTSAEETTLSVRSAGQRIGRIVVGLVGPVGQRGAGAVRTPETGSSSLSKEPVGRALGRIQPGPDGEPALSFDSAQSLFHEFGHAITHVKLGRQPGPSGLEYLPTERLENLSEWTGTLVYDPDLATRVGATEEYADGLALSRQIKHLEFLGSHLQRAAVAALDFEVHRQPRHGIGETFRALDDEFGIGPYCNVGDLAGYLIRPAFRAAPGLGLVYPWGYAFAAERAVIPPALTTDTGHRPDPTGFKSCFDPAQKSSRPDPAAVFRFHERAFEEPTR